MNRIDADPFDHFWSAAATVADTLYGPLDNRTDAAYEERQLLVHNILNALGASLEQTTGAENPVGSADLSLSWHVDVEDEDQAGSGKPAKLEVIS